MRRALRALAVGLAALAAGAGLGVPSPAAHAGLPRPAKVDARVVEAASRAGAGGTLDLVITLDRVADENLSSRLQALGTWSWTFRHLPVAGIRLPVKRLDELRRTPGVRAIYLNRRLRYELKDSARLMNTARAWGRGITGKGVTVAILDTGVDFTHPDLAPAMKANVKLVEFGSPTPVVPVEGIQNSDTTSGHGTHVAGDVAGRGTQSGGAYRGMAPEADLVGIGAGDALFIFTVVEGFDWILANREKYGIRAVNNSWGTEFEPFDPDNPVNVATRKVAEAGIVVLFAMGNSYDELTMNPYAAAPWVIPVAAGTKTGTVTDFSSGGLEVSLPGLKFDGRPIEGETRRPLDLGLYHPAVTSTGENVVSTRSNTTLLPLLAVTDDASLGPDAVWYTTMSGTSMATPETAGVVALLLQADPSLTPHQVRQVLEITARPIPGVPFWKQGYGYTDASAAVELALSLRDLPPSEKQARLDSLHAARDRALLDSFSHPTRTYAFEDPAPTGPGSVEHKILVPAGSRRVKVVTNGPIAILLNAARYDITLLDAQGNKVGDTLGQGLNISSGTYILDLDLKKLAEDESEAAKRYSELKWGEWTVRIEADLSPALPSPLRDLPIEDQPKKSIHTVAAVFPEPPVSCSPVQAFVPTEMKSFLFQDDRAEGVPYPANPKYTYVGPVPDGSLGNRRPLRYLAGTFGVVNTEVPGPEPVFSTPPLESPLTVGKLAVVETWIQGVPGVRGLLRGQLIDIAPDGTAKAIASMPENVPAEAAPDAPARTRAVVPIARGYTLEKGHRLGVRLGVTFIGTTANTLYYDSDEFPSGLSVLAGGMVSVNPCTGERVAAGAQGAAGRQAEVAARVAELPVTGGWRVGLPLVLAFLGLGVLGWRGRRA